MQNHQPSDRLSWGDTVFLNLEREGMPLNVASVCIFEGQVCFKDWLHAVESKLPLIPRYLKCVVPEPLGLGLPKWEYDTEFDLARHLREVVLKHGTDAELKSVAAKLFSQVMDRKHPLWDMTLVGGLKSNRTGLIIRLHHCLADGVAGVGLITALLDATPEAVHPSGKKGRFPSPSQRDPLNSLANSVVDSYSDFVKRLLSVWTDLFSIVERVAAKDPASTAELPRFLPEITAATKRLRFNVIYRGPQKFAWAKLPLSDLKAIRETCGTSINDVLLALVTATIRRYSELHGDRTKGELLRMMVPVNLRGNDNPGELGNRISLIPVTIPLDVRSPRKLLAAVHQRTECLKHAHAAELVSLAGGLIGMFPSVLQALAGPLLSQLPITPFNMVCTNVPGPQFPLYLLGHKMLSWYPYVPVGGEMAVNCAILSYDGAVYFGFSGDVHAAPDLRKLEKLLKTSFTQLRDDVLTPQRKSTRRKKAAAKRRARSRPAHAAKLRASGPVTASLGSSVSDLRRRGATEPRKVLAEVAV
jgi:diacylglycerol O-acyltransferase / wax synthase